MLKTVRAPNGDGTLVAVGVPDGGKELEYYVAHARKNLKPELLEKLGKRGPVIHLFYPADQVEFI